MKIWVLAGLGLLPFCAARGALVVNGDMSLAAYANGGNHCSFVDLNQGWAVKSQNAIDLTTNPGKMTWDGTTVSLLEDALAQVNSVTTETGNTLTLSFDWTAAAGASSTNVSLEYQVIGWKTNSSPTSGTFFNNINGTSRKVGNLAGTAEHVDLLDGSISNAEVNESFGTFDGIAGTTVSASIPLDLSAYGAGYSSVGDYDYIGVRFWIAGDNSDLSAIGSTLDNVQLITSNATVAADDESNFYTDYIGLVSSNVDLVADYGANGADTNDDSVALQTAIDAMTLLPGGGKIMFPAGTFYLRGILVKSNVHLVLDPATTLKLTGPTNHGTLMNFGLSGSGADALVTISNVSIRASSGRYTVDFSDVPPNPAVKAAFVNCKHVDNFMIADFNVVENYTRLSSLTLNLAENSGQYFRPRNGVVKNGDNLYGHYGYGMVQVQCGYNVLFKDLTATGGVTLRLESGSGSIALAPDNINVDQIFARNISITNGHYALMISPHTRKNGHVDADGIYAVNSLMAAACGQTFDSNGVLTGWYADSTIVRNVHAVYGAGGAQYKVKNFDAVPCQLRGLVSTNPFPYDTVAQEIYPGPSAAAARNSDPDITFTNVTQSGFLYQPRALLRGRPWENLEGSKTDLYQGCNPVPVNAVVISQTNLDLYVAKRAVLGATVSPVNATDTNVNWVSDNPDVAVVSESGLVTAVGPGSCTITTRSVDWGWYDSCAVTVTGGGGGTWTQLSSNDFELGWGDWVSGGVDAFLSTNKAIGVQCVNLQDNSATSYMELSSPMDLSPYQLLKVEFSLIATKMNYSHTLTLEYSDNGGSSWKTAQVLRYDFEFDNGVREGIAMTIDNASQNFSANVLLRIRCNAGFDGDDAYIDNVVISAFSPSGWGAYVSDYNLSGLSTNDADADGKSDLYEYALGGDPTNPASSGTAPSIVYGTNDMARFTNWEVDHSNPGISYVAEWTDDLVSNSWSTIWITETNTPIAAGYTEAERQVFGGTNDHLFFRLKVDQP